MWSRTQRVEETEPPTNALSSIQRPRRAGRWAAPGRDSAQPRLLLPQAEDRRPGGGVAIVIAAEEDGKGIGRIRMAHIPDASAASLILPFVGAAVAPGSVVQTDGWQGYSGLAVHGFTHEVSIIAPEPKRAAALLPRVHRVASLLKRWLLGTHQGAVTNKRLQR